MITWGGRRGDRALKDGAAYDPRADRWRRIATPDGPVGRHSHHAAWTGREMIVWSGQGPRTSPEGPSPEGLAYDPVSDRWRPLPVSPLGPREFDAAVWTGERLIAIGSGRDPAAAVAAYDPVHDAWQRLATPLGDSWVTPIATGDTVAFVSSSRRRDPRVGRPINALLDTSAACWRAVSEEAPPNSATAVGVLGAGSIIFVGRQGVAYRLATDAWSMLPDAGGRVVRDGSPATWAGDRVVMWGGSRGDGIRILRDGIEFIPAEPEAS